VKIVVLLGIHSQLQAYGIHDASEMMQSFVNGRTYGGDSSDFDAHTSLCR